MKRRRFDIEGLAKKLGWTPNEVQKTLAGCEQYVRRNEADLVHHVQQGTLDQRLSLLSLAWIHSEEVPEGS